MAVDNQQQEFILFGKGIGYGKKMGTKWTNLLSTKHLCR
ncbi:CAT RNA binding domain-containing protein [Leuconostoc citreum]